MKTFSFFSSLIFLALSLIKQKIFNSRQGCSKLFATDQFATNLFSTSGHAALGTKIMYLTRIPYIIQSVEMIRSCKQLFWRPFCNHKIPKMRKSEINNHFESQATPPEFQDKPGRHLLISLHHHQSK